MPSPEVGDSALTVLQYIGELQAIGEVTIFRHQVGENWRQRYRDDEKPGHLDADCFSHNDNDKEFDRRALHREALGQLSLHELVEKCADNEVYSVISHTTTRAGEPVHIPMMNFHPEYGGLNFVRDSVATMQANYPSLVPAGALLSSGRYYHYYGFGVFPDHRLSEYLSHFLMPSILVSPRYIGHSLYEGACSLRLTGQTTVKPVQPAVIELIDNTPH